MVVVIVVRKHQLIFITGLLVKGYSIQGTNPEPVNLTMSNFKTMIITLRQKEFISFITGIKNYRLCAISVSK